MSPSPEERGTDPSKPSQRLRRGHLKRITFPFFSPLNSKGATCNRCRHRPHKIDRVMCAEQSHFWLSALLSLCHQISLFVLRMKVRSLVNRLSSRVVGWTPTCISSSSTPSSFKFQVITATSLTHFSPSIGNIFAFIIVFSMFTCWPLSNMVWQIGSQSFLSQILSVFALLLSCCQSLSYCSPITKKCTLLSGIKGALVSRIYLQKKLTAWSHWRYFYPFLLWTPLNQPRVTCLHKSKFSCSYQLFDKLSVYVFIYNFSIWLWLQITCCTWSVWWINVPQASHWVVQCLNTCLRCRERWAQMEPRETEES